MRFKKESYFRCELLIVAGQSVLIGPHSINNDLILNGSDKSTSFSVTVKNDEFQPEFGSVESINLSSDAIWEKTVHRLSREVIESD